MFAVGALSMTCVLLAPPELSFSSGKFTVREGASAFTAAISSKKPSRFEPLAKASFRKDDRFVVWDSRGLVIRFGQNSKVLTLDSWCTLPKLFEKPEILRNKMMIEVGRYDSKVAQLRAARRVGSKVFLVLEWLSPNGKAWFQAVGLVDIDAKSPDVVPIGRLPGEFLADPELEPIPVVAGKLRLVWSAASSWGICTIETSGKCEVQQVGGILAGFNWTNSNTISYREQAPSGKQLLGRLYVPNGSKRTLAEVDVAAMLIDDDSPWVAMVRDDTKLWLQNLDTSSKVEIDAASRAVRCGKNVVVWIGGATPKQAWLYEPNRWQRLAEWKAKGK